MFLAKVVLKICSKFTGDTHAEVQSNFTEITLWHGCSPVNLLHILRTLFLENTSGWLLLEHDYKGAFQTVKLYILESLYTRLSIN